MKNYVKEGQKLPLYGVGPYMICAMAAVTVAGIILFSCVLKTGILGAPWTVLFWMAGVLFIILGLFIWFTGAARSGMDDNIAENRLKTDGIYAWVRNPMYSGLWIALTGISLLWHNACLLVVPVINWGIMTVVLKRTEEQWLIDLYGEEYRQYMKKVNRCIPWKRG